MLVVLDLGATHRARTIVEDRRLGHGGGGASLAPAEIKSLEGLADATPNASWLNLSETVLTTLPLLLTGLHLRGMAFFAFVFAPLVFIKLPSDTAGAFIRQVFPVYYQVFAATSVLAVLSAWGRAEAVVLGVVAAAFLFAWLWLMPRINRARDASHGEPAAAARFGRLHRISGLVNAAQMIAVLVVFVRLAT